LGLVVAVTPAVHAQTVAPKPGAKPTTATKAPEGRTATLGGGNGGRGRPLMTRDELRTCLRQQDQLAKERDDAEAERQAVEADKASLLAAQQGHEAEVAKVEAARKSVTDLNARYKAHAERVAAYNERTQAVKDLSGQQAERELKRLANDRADLQRGQAELEASRAALPDTAELFNRFNTQGKALEQRAAAWNQRNEALTTKVRAVNNERENWLSDCADRRYREEDHAAIQRGQ
jgi:chromosome segregation ATPase